MYHRLEYIGTNVSILPTVGSIFDTPPLDLGAVSIRGYQIPGKRTSYLCYLVTSIVDYRIIREV